MYIHHKEYEKYEAVRPYLQRLLFTRLFVYKALVQHALSLKAS
jgi:hypothetical protein